MTSLTHFFRLIRWPNLLILSLVQFIIFYQLVDGNGSELSKPNFFWLSFITVVIAASGYVINDIFDVEIDAINKPASIVAGKVWTLPEVKKTYYALLIIGGVMSIYLAMVLDLLLFLPLYPIAVFGLWLYSSKLKCKPIAGNLWVSLFCAGAVIIVGLPDALLGNSSAIKTDLFFYASFAFLLTWYREMVKDIEDVEGDQRADCKTFIVSYGINTGKIVTLLLGALVILSLWFWSEWHIQKIIRVILMLLQGVIVLTMVIIWWAQDKSYYRGASVLIKGTMVVGTLSLFLI